MMRTTHKCPNIFLTSQGSCLKITAMWSPIVRHKMLFTYAHFLKLNIFVTQRLLQKKNQSRNRSVLKQAGRWNKCPTRCFYNNLLNTVGNYFLRENLYLNYIIYTKSLSPLSAHFSVVFFIFPFFISIIWEGAILWLLGVGPIFCIYTNT